MSVLVGEEGGWREPLRELLLTGVAAPELEPVRSVATLSIGRPNIPTAWSVERARKCDGVKLRRQAISRDSKVSTATL